MTEAFDLDRIGGRRALRAIIDAVLEAGELALRMYHDGASQRTRKKADRSPVTAADEAVEAHLRTFLHSEFPAVGFVGEESASRRDAQGPSDMRFVLDPIDGTRAFIRGIPTWSVLLGLQSGDDAVLGVVFQPATGDVFWAVAGDGAYGNGRPLRVSSISDLSDALVAHGALAQFTESGKEQWLTTLANCCYSQRGMHDFEGYRNIILGHADAMVDPAVQLWDACAPAVLVVEAGGVVTAMDGSPGLDKGGIIASNGQIHDALLKKLNGLP